VHTSFRISYQEYDADVELESPLIVCFHMFWVLTAFTLAYPFSLCLFSSLAFFFYDDHQILGVSICGDSWWSWCWRGGCDV